MLGHDFERDKYHKFLKVQGLNRLADLLFQGIYCFDRSTLLNQLCYFHSEFGIIRNTITDEIDPLYKASEEKAKRVFEMALNEIDYRLETLTDFAAKYPVEEYEEPKTTDGSYAEMWYNLEHGNLNSKDIEKLHELVLDDVTPDTSMSCFDNIDISLRLVSGETFKFFDTYKMIYLNTFIEYHIQCLGEVKRYLLLFLPNHKTPIGKKNNTTYHSFKEIFKNQDEFESFIQILKDYDDKVIDDKMQFVEGRGHKAVLAGFYNALVRKGKVKHVNRDVAARLVGLYFGTSITGKYIDKPTELIRKITSEFRAIIR